MRRHTPTTGALFILLLLLCSSYATIASAKSFNKDACTIIEFNDELYVGTLNFKQGCELFRTPDGEHWEQLIGKNGTLGNGFGKLANHAIWSAEVFNGELYLGTINFAQGCEVYKTADGENFTRVIGKGLNANNGIGEFINHFNWYAWYMKVLNGTLYLGTCNVVFGGSLYSTTDGANWTQVIGGLFNGDQSFGFGKRVNYGIRTLFTYNQLLYAGGATSPLRFSHGCELWSSDNGTKWERSISDGFGDTQNKYSWSVSTFNDDLYIGTLNSGKGGQIWRTHDGTNWTQVVVDGFGDRFNFGIRRLVSYDGAIYASTENFRSGVEIWRSFDGTNWTQINDDGFGDYRNITARYMTVFNGELYMGLWNYVEGATIMKYNGDNWDEDNTQI